MKNNFWGRMKISVLSVFMSICFFFCGCVKPNFELLQNNFLCELEWQDGEQSYRASIEAIEVDRGRSFVMHISKPDELDGMKLIYSKGRRELEFGGIALGEGAAESYASVLEMLIPPTEFTYIGRSTKNGQELICHSNASGECNWYFDVENGMPICVENAERTVYILKIAPK